MSKDKITYQAGLFCLLIIFHTSVFAAPLVNSHLQSLLDGAIKGGLPGVSLRVSGYGIDFTGVSGVANISTAEPLTAQHSLYVASLGKTFTASIALQLCDEGKLELDVPITTWLPHEVTRRIPMSDVITLRHLLNHRSGIHDYKNDANAWRTAFKIAPNRQWTHGDVVSYLYDKPLRFKPGTRFDYSNSNYILVGMIIETVTGRPLYEHIRKRILVPLGLRHTHNGNENVDGKLHAHGYMIQGESIVDTYFRFRRYGLADSGMHSTPGDMALFVEALFGSSKLLSTRMRNEMTHAITGEQSAPVYGMGIYVQHDSSKAGLRWYLHDGIDPGYQADLKYLPEAGLTIALAANASVGAMDDVYDKLLSDVVQLVIGVVRFGRPALR
jgi:D-alanyl-D-alanine carboxypeptidase